jgi:hypothetical protein
MLKRPDGQALERGGPADAVLRHQIAGPTPITAAARLPVSGQFRAAAAGESNVRQHEHRAGRPPLRGRCGPRCVRASVPYEALTPAKALAG